MTGTDSVQQGRQSRALTAGAAGTWEWDRLSGTVQWDAALEAVYGLSEGEFGGRFEDWIALIHPEDREEVRARLAATLESSSTHYQLFRALLPDGSVRWIESRGRVRRGPDGEVIGIVGVCHDVTDRQASEDRLRRAEQRTRERLEFLAEAGALLSDASIDIEETLQELTGLVVPRLADWCAIDLLDDAGRLRMAAVAHQDPDQVTRLRAIVEQYGRTSNGIAGRVSRTGALEHMPVIPEDVLRSTARDDRHFELIKDVRPVSAVVVPLRARGRVLGALSLAHSESGRRHGEEDVTLARELADRAAVAIDTARVVAEHRSVAAMLQQALLPPALPILPGLEVAAHYDPAHSAVVGGDFYDVIGSGQDWTLVIGDVCGKGVGAASVASVARHTLHAAALREADPADVLGVLNESLLDDDRDEAYCTAVCARLVIGADSVRLAVATGGHPAPLVLRAGGTVEPIAGSGLPLGWFPEAGLASAVTVLLPGDVVFLYSDGLSEARRGPELFGTDRVEAALSETVGLPAAGIIEHMHGAVSRWQDDKRDDTAMLAMRVQPGSAGSGASPT